MEKTKTTFILALLSISLLGSRCSSIKYEDDIGFLNSAQANAMEFYVSVDSIPCKDVEGNIGACTKRIKSDQDPILRHLPKPYAYTIDVRCTEGTGIGFSMDIEEGAAWEYAIPHSAFIDFRSFTCTGEIFPHDRDNALSARWQIRFIVFDTDYKERESIYIDDDGNIILGRYAKYARVCEDGDCKNYKERTVVKVDTGKEIVAFSESEVVRFNYFGL